MWLTLQIERYAAWLHGLTGGRRYGAAILLGICAALTLPPIYALPLLPVAFSGFYFLLQNAQSRKVAFFTGWCFGFGFFTVGLYWICISLFVDPGKYLWLLPFALFGLPSLFSIYSGLAGLFVCSTKRSGIAGFLLFCVAWMAAEYARGHLFTGFPWNLIGYSWGFSGAMIQSASIWGIYGLSLLTVAFATAPVLIVHSASKAAQRLFVALMLILLLLAVFGCIRQQVPFKVVDGVKLRLVQANIEQRDKWNPTQRMQALAKHVALTLSPANGGVTHIIWPETALTFYMDEDMRTELARYVPKNGLLFTGALRRAAEGEEFHVWNGVQVLDAQAKIVGIYDKSKLVPFGEFMPLRNWLPIEKITPGTVDFSRGDGASTLHLSGIPPVSPLVCYEAIFPDSAVNNSDRPKWLLNVTNDAWFGNSSGPYQHLQMVRMRAVEQGIPVVRAANTGISAVFDAYGREVGRLDLNHEGVLDTPLPQAAESNTIYGKFLNLPFWLLMFFMLILGLCKQKNNTL